MRKSKLASRSLDFSNWILLYWIERGWMLLRFFPNVSVQKKKSLHWTAECGRKWEEVGKIVTTFWEDTITVTSTILYRPQRSILPPYWYWQVEKVLRSYHYSPYYFQEWIDNNLRWNESEYGNVKDLRFPPSTIWTPDILMYNRYHSDLSVQSKS